MSEVTVEELDLAVMSECYFIQLENPSLSGEDILKKAKAIVKDDFGLTSL